MTNRDEIHYKLLKELMKYDSRKVRSAFNERFEAWWKGIEPWMKRQLKNQQFVKDSRVTLDKWIMGIREGFYSNLAGALASRMESWAVWWSFQPLELNVCDDPKFDMEGYIRSAKQNMIGENLKTSLDSVFYVPTHALDLAIHLRQYLKGKPVDPDNRERYRIIDGRLNENLIRKPKPLSKSAVIRNLCATHPVFRGVDNASNLRKDYDWWVKNGRK